MGHTDLEHRDAEVCGERPVDTQRMKCLEYPECGNTAGDDTEPGVVASDQNFVERIGLGESDRRADLVFAKPKFLVGPRVRSADVHTPGGKGVVRQGDLGPASREQDAGRRIQCVGTCLEADPGPAET